MDQILFFVASFSILLFGLLAIQFKAALFGIAGLLFGILFSIVAQRDNLLQVSYNPSTVSVAMYPFIFIPILLTVVNFFIILKVR